MVKRKTRLSLELRTGAEVEILYDGSRELTVDELLDLAGQLAGMAEDRGADAWKGGDEPDEDWRKSAGEG